MKNKKRIVSVFLTLMLTFSFVPLFSGFSEASSGKWISTWCTSPVDGSVSLASLRLQDIIPARSTIRTELKVTMGGTKLRFKFANTYGKAPVTISAASVARTDGEGKAKIKEKTARSITFNDGSTSVTVGAGKTTWSDEISFATSDLERISVSIYFNDITYITTTGLSNGRTFLSRGSLLTDSTPSRVNDTSLSSVGEINISSGSITYHSIPFLSEVLACSEEPDACTAVFIGDSTLVNDTYLYFADRLYNAGKNNIAVINEAIIGNKLLSDGTGIIGNLYGEAMINRFKRDALTHSNVKYIFVKIGLNDILHQFTKSMSGEVPHVSTDEIIEGYKQLIDLAHANGIKIYFFTKTAWNGYERSFLGQTGDLVWNEEAQKMCDTLDEWILSDNGSDGHIDCSPLRDPSNPTALCPSFTIDGAHLTTLGSIALADLIPVDFVGANPSYVKTAAEINGVDPYKEKNDITERMQNNPSSPAEEETTAPGEEASSEESTTEEETTEETTTEETTTAEVTTRAPEPAEQTTVYIQPVISPVIPETTTVTYSYSEPEKKGVVYNVSDIGVDSIGGNNNIFFLLILITSVTVSAAVIILTVGRRKETF